MSKKTLSIVLLFLISAGCVYFNTFYNAQQSFKKAIKIIDNAPEGDELPSSAKSLLAEAITNSNMVIENFPDSKYVDDAFYIIGRSSFIRGDNTTADKYFNRLIYEFPDSPYKQESEIWLTYTHYKMGLMDSSLTRIQELLDNPPRNKNLRYILYKMMGEIDLERKNVESAFEYFEKAARLADTDSKRSGIYNKLITIAEKRKDYTRAIYLLEQLQIYGATSQVRQEAKMKWLEYNREAGNYDIVLAEIEDLLADSNYEIHHLSLELEKAKIYLSMKDYSRAENLLKDILENTTYKRKEPTAEACFHLGRLALIDNFDLDLATTYLDSVTKIYRQVSFKSRITALKQKISKYQYLSNEYEYALSVSGEEEAEDQDNILDPLPSDTTAVPIPAEMTATQSKVEPADSLLFTMAEMLLFEFNRQELALEKYEKVVENYPDSKFVPQSLYVLNKFTGNKTEKWRDMLLEKYPDTPWAMDLQGVVVAGEEKVNSMESLRDMAWVQLEEDPLEAVNTFNRIYTEFDDPLSLYSVAFVYDKYLYDLERSIVSYRAFLEAFPEHELSELAEIRLENIRQAVEQKKNEVVGWVPVISDVVIVRAENDSLAIIYSDDTLSEGIADSLSIKPSTAPVKVYPRTDSLFYQMTVDTVTISGFTPEMTITTADSVLFIIAGPDTLQEDTTSGKITVSINPVTFFTFSTIGDSLKYRVWDDTPVEHPELAGIYELLDIQDDADEQPAADSLTAVAEIDTSAVTDVIPTDLVGPLPQFPPMPTVETTFTDSIELPDTVPENPSAQVIDESPPEVEAQEKAQTDSGTVIAKKPTPAVDSDVLPMEKAESRWAEHVIKPGETLETIARMYFKKPDMWQDIYTWNLYSIGDDPNLIYPFHILKIEGVDVKELPLQSYDEYVVKTGDTLWNIAGEIYGNPRAWSILYMDNAGFLPNGENSLYPGMKLKIRSKLN